MLLIYNHLNERMYTKGFLNYLGVYIPGDTIFENTLLYDLDAFVTLHRFLTVLYQGFGLVRLHKMFSFSNALLVVICLREKREVLADKTLI